MKSEITRHNEIAQDEAVSSLFIMGTLLFLAVAGLIIVILTSVS